MFHSKCIRLDYFSLWDIERNQKDVGTQFTSKDFQEIISVPGVRI